MFRIVVLAFLLSVLAGCVTTENWTREQAEAVTTRNFEGVSKEQVIEAAELALRKSDPEDFRFTYHDDGFLAQRKTFIFLLVSASNTTWNFAFVADERGGSVHTRLNISSDSTQQASTIVPTLGPAGVNTSTSVVAGEPWQNPEVYRLFYERLEYFLGRRETWPKCSSSVGPLEPLCFGAPT